MDIKSLAINVIILAVIIGFTSGINCYAASDNSINKTTVIKKSYSAEKVFLDKTSVMEDYIAKSRRKIKNNWYPPTDAFENKATIIITLNKKGELQNCVISESSNNEKFDNSLIDAVKKTKFAPLPNEVKDEAIDIDYTFDMQKRKISK